LHFPPILEDANNKKSLMFDTAEPKTIESIDLIENEKGDETDFNFYGIKLDDNNKRSSIY
jgi:fructose-1-phosphate kinase PfkB-like protein